MEETAGTGGAKARAGDAAIPQPVEDIVERWWEDHFPGSPVAQVTAAWNHAFAAKQELKRRLVNLVQGVL
jgi:hypothetical protein